MAELTVKEFLVQKAQNKGADESKAREYADIFLATNPEYQGDYYLNSYSYALQSQLSHQFGAFLDIIGVVQSTWTEERRAAIKILRDLCKDFGDNDWSDDLELEDIIEKHLARHLYRRNLDII